MTLGDFNGSEHLEQFDFDSLLQGSDITKIKHFSFKDGAAIDRGI